MTVIDREILGQKLITASDMLIEKCTYLCEIDSKFGDGDHGVTIKKIADLIKREVAALENMTIGEFFGMLGTKIMGVNGGSAGPLWGTLFGGFGIGLAGKFEITAEELKEMLANALLEMQDITTAKVGDKTMMDTLIPAVEAATAAPNDIEAVLNAANEEAQRGKTASEGFVAKYGRAKSYKELTIGTPDAGAVSLATLFEGLAK